MLKPGCRTAVRLLATVALAGAALSRADEPPPAADDSAAEDDGGRIVGGFRAQEGSAPWQAEIYSTNVYTAEEIRQDQLRADGDREKKYLYLKEEWERNHRCGGMYLGDSWVLTAAHCVTTVKGNFLTDRRIRLGTQDISQPGANYRIDRAVVHKDYVPADKLHDIALLHFVQDDGKQARLPPAVRPIRLLGEKRSDRPLASFDRVSVTGWGLTGARSSGARALGTDGSVLRASSALKQVDLAVFPREKCESVAEYRGFVGPGVICAGSIVKGDDSCSGDSGGPMTRAQGDERVLVGLVSWGKGCGLPGMPALYTRVDHYLDWIKAARKKAPPGVVSRL